LAVRTFGSLLVALKQIARIRESLIDGQQLSEMMIDHDVGVSVVETYAVKRIDSDYFSEE